MEPKKTNEAWNASFLAWILCYSEILDLEEINKNEKE